MFDDEGRPEISDTRWAGGDYLPGFVKGSGDYFTRSDVIAKIEVEAEATLLWMQEGTQSYSGSGDLRYEPWWPDLPVTNSIIFKCGRERMLLDRAYEHGILNFLRRLEACGVIQKLNDRIIDLVVESMTPVVLNQLAMKCHAEGVPDGVSLKELSKLFGNGKNTKPAKVRDRFLGDLAAVGLFKAREAEGWDIAIGPVGDAFFSKVYAPITNEIDIKYAEPKK
ncbi:hypothetical protein [uncultured Roseibium sp.]|uniref:hypothetical protein n=1 Tax=uncultured Roseibium sp. TaxID=1936171 RepID=UPI002602626E|nr:hypothetical protein [uncultured Roseibium sp.]